MNPGPHVCSSWARDSAPRALHLARPAPLPCTSYLLGAPGGEPNLTRTGHSPGWLCQEVWSCTRRGNALKRTLASLRPEEACSVLLDGSASIRVHGTGQVGDECVATGMCATARLCPASEMCGPANLRFLEIGISGHLVKTRTACHLNVGVPSDPRADRLPLEFAFDPELPSARSAPWLLEYLCTGYSEVAEATQAGRNGDLLYPVPAPDGAPVRWTGRFALSEVGAVGELVRGALEYRGKDATGQERNVHAEFAVPRYPDKS